MPKQSAVDRLEALNAAARAELDALPDASGGAWTPAEDEAIVRGYGAKKRVEFAKLMLERFGRTWGAVNVRAARLRMAGKPVGTYIARRT